MLFIQLHIMYTTLTSLLCNDLIVTVDVGEKQSNVSISKAYRL